MESAGASGGSEGRVRRWLARSRWLLVALCLGVGGLGIDPSSVRWSALGLLLFSLPVGLQLLPGFAARYAGVCLGAFLLIQAALSPLVSHRILGSRDLKTLPPQLDVTLEVSPARLPGIEGRQHVSTDAQGFRVTREIGYAHKSRPRVFAIGGSTTEQIHLDDHRTWTHLLQQALRSQGIDVEVINTGVSGVRARHQLAMLRHVRRYGPDLVVLLPGINDWNWQVLHHFAGADLARFDDGEGPLRLRNTLLGRALLRLGRGTPLRPWDEAQTADVLSFAEYNPQRDSLARSEVRSYRPAAVSPEFDHFLRAIAGECRRAAIPCLWLTQPTGYSERASAAYRRSWWMTPPNRPYTLDLGSLVQLAALYNDHVRALANAQGQPFFDLAAQLTPGFGSFYDDCHFNRSGAERVAALLVAPVAELLRVRER